MCVKDIKPASMLHLVHTDLYETTLNLLKPDRLTRLNQCSPPQPRMKTALDSRNEIFLVPRHLQKKKRECEVHHSQYKIHSHNLINYNLKIKWNLSDDLGLNIITFVEADFITEPLDWTTVARTSVPYIVARECSLSPLAETYISNFFFPPAGLWKRSKVEAKKKR